MAEALASHYAKALADATFRPDSGLDPQEALVQLRSAAAVIVESGELRKVLLSPAIARAKKKAVVEKLAGLLGAHRLINNFLVVIVGHRRLTELRAIIDSFEFLVDERMGLARADISSARELNAAERQQIERVLGVKIGQFIRGFYSVDPTLLGGVRVQVASKEYDATVRGKLDRLRSKLLGAH